MGACPAICHDILDCCGREFVNVNINPHKIVLNAQGKADDVQANIPIVLASARIVAFDVSLFLDNTEDPVALAESARYCLVDQILIIGFDRTALQDNPAVQAMANTTVIATVVGTIAIKDTPDSEWEYIPFSGEDDVEIVKPGKKGK